MDKIKLINSLKDEVLLSYDSKDTYEVASWKMQIGVLISREQAELFIELLEREGDKSKQTESDCAISDVMFSETEVCVHCQTNKKSAGSDYCGKCIDEGNYIKQT